jgi:hypothetical protein
MPVSFHAVGTGHDPVSMVDTRLERLAGRRSRSPSPIAPAGLALRAFIQGSSTSIRRQRAQLPSWLAAFTVAFLLATLAAGPATAATSTTGATDDPAVISEWNELAVTTLLGDTSKQLVESILYTAFVQAAVYDAVVGVEGR